MGNLNGIEEEGQKILKECPSCHSTFETYKEGTGRTLKGPFHEELRCKSCFMIEAKKAFEAMNNKKR